ncbi:MAG: nucleoside hydrolase [Anaerolineae bacterium]
MLRSPWFWVSVALIAAGVALTALLGVFRWLALALALAVFLLVGILLLSVYAIKPKDAPALPKLEQLPDHGRISVVHDCDLTMGKPFRDIGDGLALLYLLGEPSVDLRAVTTTYGNGPVDMTTLTARQLLSQLDVQDVNVIRGAAGPDHDPGSNQAAMWLVDKVNARPNELVILATGALTNLKHAWALDEDFFRKIRSLYLAGGVTGKLVWSGHQLQERSLSLDPEAAHRVIHADCPVTITPAEAGLTAIFRSPQFAALQALQDPVSNLITRRTRLWFGVMRLWFRDDGFPMWESVAATALTHPEHLLVERVHLPTSIQDLHTGRLVTDPDFAGPVRLVRRVQDYDGFIRSHFAAWQRLGHSVVTSRTSIS